MAARVTAIVLAAGRGERLGADKALVELGPRTALQAVVDSCREAGCERILAVRRRGAAAVPGAPEVVEVDTEEMVASLRAGLRAAAPGDPDGILVFPIDYAMVRAATVATLVRELRGAAGTPAVVLPVCRDRPGHPIGLSAAVLGEVLDPARTATLRDVIRREPGRVRPVPVEDGWTLRDIDRPEDLLAARGHLAHLGAATELMGRHRSHRAYRPEPVGDAQLRWLVDSARHASTSSFVQAYAVVAVRDPEQKSRAAVLCADQRQIHEAPVFLAICADLHKLAAACHRHGARLEADSLEAFVQATVDAALLGQNLQLAAESEGLGACMIGAARNHPVELAELLGLPPHVYVVFGMTIGWPADDPVPRGRMRLDAVLHLERYDSDPAATEAWLDDADARMRAWSREVNERRAPGARPVDETRGWSERMAFLFRAPNPPKGREELMAHLRSLGFGLREPGSRP